MKLMSFAVPCYNSEEYMKKCIESLLKGGEDVEIIVVNDGSHDNTREIAEDYVRRYPSIVKAVHKENGGHGSGVNKGLELASGLYYKVVDSDDWLDETALKTLLETIKKHRTENALPDLYLTNFVYEKVYEGSRYVRRFTKNFPVNKLFGWEKVKKFHTSSVLLIHSLIYKTEKLRESNTVLPEHTFYVDNIFAYKPLPYMKKLYYLDIDLYRYFIGREDQSVSRENIVRRYEQQIRVMKEMAAAYSYEEIKSFAKGLKRYMLHDLGVIMTLMFTTGGKDNPTKRKRALKEVWEYIKSRDKKLYRYLKYNTYPVIVDWMPFKLQGRTMLMGYKFFRAVLKCS